MAYQDRPNLFILLDIDPDQPWNQAEFERRIKEKRSDWSKLLNHPNKALEAKRKMALVPEFQRIAQDEAERTRQVAEARTLKNQEQADQLEMLSKELELLQGKGYILEEELMNLATKYKGMVSEAKIRKRLTVPLRKETDRVSPRPVLDPTVAREIQTKLQGLNKENLYDFLGMKDRKMESRLLLQQATVLYNSAQNNANKTVEVTLTSGLAGHCKAIFISDDERAKYDETLRLQDFEEIKEKVNLAGAVTKSIAAAQVEQLLREAKEKKLDLDETRTVILEHARKKGFAVVISELATDSIKRLQRCGCGVLNPENNKYCTACRQPLTQACPKCGKNVASHQMACGNCGFPTGNRTWVQFLLNEAQQAFDGRDYPAAKDFLDQASQAWPGTTTGPILQRLKGLESQIAPAKEQQDALLRQLKTAVHDKRFYAARDLLAKAEQTLPAGSSELTTTRQEVETAIGQVESKLAAARRSEGHDHRLGHSNQTAHVERTEEMCHGKPVIRYFVSYARDDDDLKEKLLKPLKQRLAIAKDYCFEAWDDEEILTGERWHEQIQAAIAHCQFGLLLVSPAFLGSVYIKDHELPAFVASNLAAPEPEKQAIPVALKRIPFDKSIDLKGLEQRQIFHDRAGKAFQEHSGKPKAREDFAWGLFQQILKIVKRYGTVAGRNDDQGHSEATDPEKLVQIYYDVVQICRDCQEAKDALARTPPSAPTSAQATVGGTVIHLTWQPSRSRDVRYTVVRKQRSRPVSVGDGEKLATVVGTVYDDATAEAGVPIFYAIFADREGASSKDGATVVTPVLLLAEVSQLMAQVSDRRVSLRWQAPPNVDDIVVLRSDRGYPRSLTDGQRIPLLGKQQAVDTGVENDRKYFYTVICQFMDYSGKRITTSGVHAEAIPQQPPEPIRELRIVASGPLHDRQIDLQWQPPRKGEVVIIKSDKPLGLNFSDVVPRQALAKYGGVVATVANQARDKISQFGFYYYLPVVVFQDTAYIGQEQRYVCVDDVSGLSVQNLGHALRLQWQWPANCQEVIVAYSHHGWPQPGASGTTAVSLTKAQYDLRGYHDLSNPTQADYYTTVFAVINHDGQRITSAGQATSCRKRITLKSRIGLTYEIKKPWFESNFTLTLDINGQGTVPALLLVRKQGGLPMNKVDGEIVLRLPPVSVGERRMTFKLPDDVKQPQSFAQLFLEEDEGYEFVTIRQPDRNKLRLF